MKRKPTGHQSSRNSSISSNNNSQFVSKIPGIKRVGSSTSFDSNSSFGMSISSATKSANIRSKQYNAKHAVEQQRNAGVIKSKAISFKLTSGSDTQPQPQQISKKPKFCTQCGWKFIEDSF